MIGTQANPANKEVVEQVVRCPHCHKEWKMQIAPKRGKMGNYSIECPDCKQPWSSPLAGEIIDGPHA